MLGEFIDNLSILIGINNEIIPNIITFIVVVLIVTISFKSQLSIVALGTVYAIAMAILTLLGIDSIFNIITLIENGLESIF